MSMIRAIFKQASTAPSPSSEIGSSSTYYGSEPIADSPVHSSIHMHVSQVNAEEVAVTSREAFVPSINAIFDE
ncbi:hypothetical protein BZG36_01472 [Bifiguratus adelaidae]|uniref:Uncharacterized protein n=1 Tax=Bifiguratus adelaidae TaxID=1938954 RepID=A0A261Y4T9_9FUNG|nr:hypothetical protein BZG36_01472 [Bifiguratus adelaidae]